MAFWTEREGVYSLMRCAQMHCPGLLLLMSSLLTGTPCMLGPKALISIYKEGYATALAFTVIALYSQACHASVESAWE